MPNVIDIVVQASTGAASASLNSLNRGMHATGSGAAALGKGVGLGLAGVAGGLAVMFKTGLDESKDASAGQAQLEAGIKSTHNAANLSVDGMENLATSIQNMSGQTDDSIVAAEKLLQTFTNIRNTKTDKIFDQATLAAANMAAKMGGDASSNAILLGKALNDPVKGISALTKVGVSFSQHQKDTIASMVKVGNVAGAQKVILKELGTEFGGAAKAAGESLPGQMARAHRAFEDVSQNVVQALMPSLTKLLMFVSTVLVPGLGKLIDFLSVRLRPAFDTVVEVIRNDVVPVLERLVSDFRTKVLPIIQEVIGWIVAHLPQMAAAFLLMWANVKPTVMAFAALLLTIYNSVLKPIVQWVIAHWPQIEVVMKIVFIAIAIAAKILLVALQVVFLAIAVAIRVLATVIGWLLNNVVVPTFRAISTVIRTEVSVWTAIIHGVMAVIRGIGSAFSDAYSAVSGWISKLVRLLSGLPGKVSSATSGLFNGIRDAFRDAINDVIDIWNRLHFHVPHIPGTSIGGDITVPQIGHMATGGIGGGLTEVGERGRELLNLPHGTHVRSNPDTERASAQRGGPAVVHLTLDSSGSPIDDFLMQLLRKSIRLRGGNVQAVLGPAG